jgi:shikimate kinase
MPALNDTNEQNLESPNEPLAGGKMQKSHPHRSRNIVFIGMPGVGKTLLGRVYAFRTGREFVDFDALLEKQSGKTIREIFATEGEAGFRAREQRLLQRLAHKRGAVLSMGGGTLCNPANMRFARTLGIIVQLQASSETLARRIFAEKHKRPMFAAFNTESDVQQKVGSLLSLRAEFYNCSDVELNTDHSSIDCLVLELMQLEKRSHSILQNRVIPKILLTDSSETKGKTSTFSLIPTLEDPSLNEAKERTPCETYDDLIWKESLQENSPPKRERKEQIEQASLKPSDDSSNGNKKKRRKKKKKPEETASTEGLSLKRPGSISLNDPQKGGSRNPSNSRPQHRSGARESHNG